MLDIALKILPEIVKQDMPKKWKIACLEERLDKAWTVVEELDEWESELRLRHHGVLYVKAPSAWEGVYEHRLDFPGTSAAIAFAMYTAVRIHVATLIANVSDEMLSRAPKVAGRIVTLWPLETAWELFGRVHMESTVDVSQEMAWCRSMAERHASLGIPPFQWR
ncbi:hypothetical protein A1O7_00737 [Cladophialophora yegresii CBS 114405]|uniref:Uncharacterized protein n=1 Tax=Cladophialophora yegresii CBS 114405 TaxID=1182544 RepID=W9WII0_9EURO|nr:uncharacterized protein A1O7_00737 [Cladophialophora yegresii CBS 114405]EXJ64401.1 hypothetical protein A1O7_00737 [Cladophialophora yegresii CBS 114405]